MKDAGVPVYYDRRSRALRIERVHAADSLHWLYNTRAGGVLGALLVGTPWFSRLYGWLHRTRWSRRKIRPFVERMGVDMGESSRRIEEFESFSDFFTRELEPGRRPVRADPETCVAPADGKMLAYPEVEAGRAFRIKRSTFDLGGLLRDRALVETFAGGSMVISRLGLADYHGFHFPDSGVPSEAVSIPGRYHAGGPYALRTLVPFFKENHRMVTLFASDHFGPIGIVEIGALTVGSIRQCCRAGVRVTKGRAKGFFELGGSTVVLLFHRGALRLDEDLVSMTEREIETCVRMGEPIGRARS